MKPTLDLSLYLILVPELCTHYTAIEVAKQAVDNGVTLIQLRMKNTKTHDIIVMAEYLKPVLGNVPLIINDDIEAAHISKAAGVHLGQGDTRVNVARKILGDDAIIGVSINTEQHIHDTPKDFDYIGVGPVYPTKTKLDHKPPLGLDGLEKLAQISPTPCVAIGGIKTDNAKSVLERGVNGIAIVSEICSAENPAQVTANLKKAIQS